MLKSKPSLVRRLRQPIEGTFCQYTHRVCMQARAEGSDLCLRHVLEDKNAPYRQCSYMSKTGKRCPNAAPKADKKEGYCLEHAKRALYLRQKSSRKRRPRETPETLLEHLEHYGNKPEEVSGRETKRGRISSDAQTSRLLEYGSSSESESEQTLVDQAWRGDIDSDAESIDSEQEDVLKHAGVYTAEEVAQVTRDKLIRLQSLYIEQFKRLQHVLREKRRKYLHTVRRERESLGSIHSAKEDSSQRERYDEFISLKRYHKRYGKEALLHRQSKERRIAATEGNTSRPPAYQKCTHVTKGNRCGARTVPLSKFCTNHILHDVHQVLYQPCGYGAGICKRPVAVGTLSDAPTCLYHSQLNAPRQHHPAAEEEHLDENKDVDVVVDVIGDDEFKLELTEFAESIQTAVSSSATGFDLASDQPLMDTSEPQLEMPLTGGESEMTATLDGISMEPEETPPTT